MPIPLEMKGFIVYSFNKSIKNIKDHGKGKYLPGEIRIVSHTKNPRIEWECVFITNTHKIWFTA